MPLRSIEEYDAIYAGKDHQKLIWPKGDPLPPASQEMEAYYAYGLPFDQYRVSAAQPFEGGAIDEFEQMDRMNDRLRELRNKVPERQ